jgi:hypothetical protein
MKRGPGRPANTPSYKELLSEFIPAADIFDDIEKKMYEGLIAIYMKDFDEDQLTANDMDDIISIAMNRVLEFRLLKSSKGNADKHMDASASIERLRKQTDKLKENLATRRRDRIDPKKYSGFSIVDLAVGFDADKKSEVYAKSERFRTEESDVLDSELLVGNRDDEDAEIIESGD